MRPSKIEPGEAIAEIRNVFRQHGFDGASLTLLSQATGLKRASLYHRFPDGKEGMAMAAIDSAAGFLEEEIFVSLSGAEPWQTRLQNMCEQLQVYYDGGLSHCLLAAFSFGSIPSPVRKKVRLVFCQWQDRLAALALDAGHCKETANNIAERILVEIQGGLIVASLLDDKSSFQRVLDRLENLVADKSDD